MFPKDILLFIASFLSGNTILSLRLVCKLLCEYIDKDRIIHKLKYKSHPRCLYNIEKLLETFPKTTGLELIIDIGSREKIDLLEKYKEIKRLNLVVSILSFEIEGMFKNSLLHLTHLTIKFETKVNISNIKFPNDIVYLSIECFKANLESLPRNIIQLHLKYGFTNNTDLNFSKFTKLELLVLNGLENHDHTQITIPTSLKHLSISEMYVSDAFYNNCLLESYSSVNVAYRKFTKFNINLTVLHLEGFILLDRQYKYLPKTLKCFSYDCYLLDTIFDYIPNIQCFKGNFIFDTNLSKLPQSIRRLETNYDYNLLKTLPRNHLVDYLILHVPIQLGRLNIILCNLPTHITKVELIGNRNIKVKKMSFYYLSTLSWWI